MPRPRMDNRTLAQNILRRTLLIAKHAEFDLSEAVIAERLGMSEEQFHAQIFGDVETPDGLADRIYHACQDVDDASVQKTNRQELVSRVQRIRQFAEKQGFIITDKDIADIMETSMEEYHQLSAGIFPTSEEMIERLKAWYKAEFEKANPGMQIVYVSDKVVVPIEYPDDWDEEEDEDEETKKLTTMRNSRKRAISTIDTTLKMSESMGQAISIADVAARLGMTHDQLHAQLYGEEVTPEDLSTRIVNAYEDMYEKMRLESNSGPLRHTVDVIKRLSAEYGPDVTDMEIAGTMGISMEGYERFIKGELPTPHEMLSKLNLRYRELYMKAHPGKRIYIQDVTIEEVRDEPVDED